MSQKRIVEVRLEALVDEDELDEEDQELSSSYEYEIDDEVPESQLANHALDTFHTEEVVNVLDDFYIAAYYNGELLEEDADVEPYSTNRPSERGSL